MDMSRLTKRVSMEMAEHGKDYLAHDALMSYLHNHTNIGDQLNTKDMILMNNNNNII